MATKTTILAGIQSDSKSLTATVTGDDSNVLRAETDDEPFHRVGNWRMQGRYTLDGRTVTTSAATFYVAGLVDG